MGYLVVRKTNFQRATKEAQWFEWTKSLLDLYSTRKSFFLDGIHHVSFLQMRRWILGHSFEGKDKQLRNLLLDAMLSADKKSAGSEVYVPWLLWNSIEGTTKRSTSQVYLRETLNKTYSEKAKDVFQTIFQSVGPLTKLIIKPSYERDIVLKYRNSFCFNLGLDPQFHRIIGNQQIEQTNPVVIMIEGSPETLSEIDSLLRWNHESGRPVLLIARSFPEEISATLANNWLRGSLSVLPIPYGTSIDSINLAADMCAVSGGTPISAHFGDVISISTMDEDKRGFVDRLEWSNGKLYLHKQVNVDRHVHNLIEKLKTIEEEELQSIYRDRILSLSNDAMEIWIPKEDVQLQYELDALLKHYSGFVISGMVETPIGCIPSCFFEAAKESARSLKEKILNIGGFLLGVEDAVVARR